MRIVVTGALGHIGSRLIRVLPVYFASAEIVMLDNLSTQRFPSLFDLPGHARYRFVECDVTEDELEPFVAGADAVIHLAALTDAASSFEKRGEVERNNYVATERVAEACLKHGVRLIVPSSTSVYGTQKDTVDEDCSAEDLKPQSPYADTKLKEEALVQRLADRGLRGIVLRFGTIFGTSPGMRFHTAINKFCWQAVMGQPLTVWRTAYDQVRPYLDLSDAVAAVAFFLDRDLFDGRVYNVVTENATVRMVVDRISAHVPTVDVRFVDERIMNQLSYSVRNTRLDALGFEFDGDMQKGIRETIRLLGRYRGAPVDDAMAGGQPAARASASAQ